jgi:hypothetical protein
MDRTRLHKRPWLLALLALVPAGGCNSMSHTDRGLLTGGGLGAVTGTVVGAAAGRPGLGAAVGAGVGGAAGAVAGASADRAERREEARQAAVRQQAPTLPEIVAMTSGGSSDDVIITQIRNSGAVYRLTPQDIVTLQNNGVREPVIRELQATAYRPAGAVYVVRPAPPPPAFGVGV